MKGNLLLVDDEPALLRPLKALLSPHADIVFMANNGIEALKIIEQENVHCILSDIHMPMMTGVEFIKSLRDSKNDVPLIFYTGHGNIDLMMEAARYGAFDFLNKPDLEGLEEVIVKGLQAGISPSKVTTVLEHISEYQLLLKELEKTS